MQQDSAAPAKKKNPWRTPREALRTPEAAALLASAAALLVLGPLRGPVGALHIIAYAAALVLFLVPGFLVSWWMFGRHLSRASLVPFAFAASTGAFGLLGIPFLMLDGDLDSYLTACGAVLAASLVAALVAAFRRRAAEPVVERADSGALLLWAPFLLSSAALALVSRSKVPNLYDDMWIYLSYVREFMGERPLGRFEPYFSQENGLSRLKINGWMLEQAALSRLSGLDPIELVLHYLNPTMVFVALLAFYALARLLFRSEAGALVAGCVCALYFLVQLQESILPPGSEFAVRLVEDKYAARFVFLPVALCVAFLFLERKRVLHLLFFAFLCWGSVAVHPAGLAIIGLSVAGLCAVHVAVNWRDIGAWLRTAGLGISGLSVGLLPVALVVATGESFAAILKAADINDGDPDVLANMVFVRPVRRRIWEFADGSFVMHPSYILDPIVFCALLVGVPFLFWRLRRGGGVGLAAQMLLGVLLLVTAVNYVPPIATFMGNNVVVPGQLHRLAWPIPLAALITVSWMLWEVLRYARKGLAAATPARRWPARLLPLFVVLALAVAAAPDAARGAWDLYVGNRTGPERVGLGFDPVFPWLRDNVEEPSVIMAPDAENTLIPAWSSNLDVVSRRGFLVLEVLDALQERTGGKIDVPQGSYDIRTFFSTPEMTPEKTKLLRDYGVDYALVFAGSPLDATLSQTPGFTRIEDAPNRRYTLYAVDPDALPGG